MTARLPDGGEAPRSGRPAGAEVEVWDLGVRIFHWLLAGLFTTAYVSAGHSDAVHSGAGYAIAALVGLRVVWGLIGSRHARFRDFLYRPAVIGGFIADTLRLRARRYLGHNPAGGAMVVALLLALALTCASGVMMTLDALWGQKWIEVVHDIAAQATLVLIGLHVLGVLVASLEHRENLVRSMLTGRKRL